MVSHSDIKNSQAKLVVALIDKLFMIKRGISNFTAAERLVTRIKESNPILDEFWVWIEQTYALAKTKLEIAIEYAAKLRDGLMDFMTDGRIMISNNIAKRRVRPVTIGHKNYPFSTSEA
ncbi:hypothetical protein C6P16_08360 [Weissella confusa]|uniref:IS66 family transposase n=1 Tax=Weissella confusa TaxID=1583 RepID=UPI00107F8D3D|nr:transposase [Weissella confusa]QBZ03265.1 hypothetical protein C6P13_08335 [Weissella confusa]TGE59388.1 hypothetical protein C6P16_08360 [Weissella confusa]TGE67261.1 hypothetical protein C6P15_08870 [Weissella confusa]TGE67740.1 hypothetical protein C6P14_08355 [Weissella confusa]